VRTIKVITGFGYFRDDQDRIVAKAQLPPSDHPIRDGFNYVEVADQDELDAVEVYEDPAATLKHEQEQKITDKMRAIAIEALKEAGELPADYKG